MANKRELSEEEKAYVLKSYRTVNNNEIGKKLGVNPKSVLRILNRLGVKRSHEDIRKLIQDKDRTSNGAEKKRSIEGGGRANYKTAWHKTQWINKNGKIPEGMILVYSTGDFTSWKDLVLMPRKKSNTFIKKRDSNIRSEKKRLEKEKKNQIVLQRDSRRREKEKQDEKAEKFLSELKKDPSKFAKQSLEGKVPVRIDHRTIIYAKRERCEALSDGTYILKKGETTSVKPIGFIFESASKKSAKKKKSNIEEDEL